MNIKRSIAKRLKKFLANADQNSQQQLITNLYSSQHARNVLISYITAPFLSENEFKHQNFVTSHIIAEGFSDKGYNVDIVDYNNRSVVIDYNKYDVIFGFGHHLESSFYVSKPNLFRMLFVTGTHEALQNAMSLQSVKDFQKLSGLWLASEARVISDSTYYAMTSADVAIILARGFVYEDFRSRFENKLYSLNNNVIEAFKNVKPKDIGSRSKSFLYLSGANQIYKGLSILLEVSKKRPDLKFYVVIRSLDPLLENYYHDILHTHPHVKLVINIGMHSADMKEIIEECSYSLAPSYADGMPGGTIEPMYAGLIPVVSKYCGFAREKFIVEMDELNPVGLERAIDNVLGLDDETYLNLSNAVKDYARKEYSIQAVKTHFEKILSAELS